MAQQIVNLTELSLKTGKAKDTIKVWMTKDPTFPCIAKGTYGRGYQFDLGSVTTWLEDRERRRRAEADQRRAALARLAQEFGRREAVGR